MRTVDTHEPVRGVAALTRFRGASLAAGSKDERAESALVSKLCVFTDTEGRCGSCFSAQKWVITPMAGTVYRNRLLRGVFQGPRKGMPDERRRSCDGQHTRNGSGEEDSDRTQA